MMCDPDPFAPVRAALHTLRLHGFTGVLIGTWTGDRLTLHSEGVLAFGPDAVRLWTHAHSTALAAVRAFGCQPGRRVVVQWSRGVPTGTHLELGKDV